MIDFVRAVALLLGIARSARHRFAWGAALGVLAAYPLAIVTSGVLASRPAPGESAPALLGFAFVFFGPTALQGYTGHAPLPLAALFDAWPLVVPLASGAFAGAAAMVASRRAAALRPESDESRVLDRIAAPFVLAAVLDGILAVCGVMMHLLNR
jgi:hypothetical protein